MNESNELDNDAPLYPFGLCCYLLPADRSREDARQALRSAGIARLWLSLTEVRLRDKPYLAMALQSMHDENNTGCWPMVTPKVAFALSEGEREVFELIIAPGLEQAFISRFFDGYRQDEGRHTQVPAAWDADLAGLTAEQLAREPIIAAMGQAACGEHGEALARDRRLAVPEWTDKGVDLFRFSERRNSGVDPDGQEGRVAFVALDLKRLGEEVHRLTSADARVVLAHYSKGDHRKQLGPMQGDLAPCMDRLRNLPRNAPALEIPEPLDLVELLAVVHSWASTPGNRLAYLDEVVLPLLNLNEGCALPALDDEELEELEALPLPAAMADQLPYHAPEGELMESFDDEELRPLAEVLELPGAEQGAIWLLDPERLMGRLQALDPGTFGPRVEGFLRQWWEAESARWDGDQQAWLASRVEQDQAELTTFFSTANELQTLIEICQRNDLALGVLFYE